MRGHRWKLGWLAVSIPSLVLVEFVGVFLAGCIIILILWAAAVKS